MLKIILKLKLERFSGVTGIWNCTSALSAWL